MHTDYSSLVLIAIAAFVTPILASRIPRIRIPAVVAEIFAGLLLGRSGLGLVSVDEVIEFLALFGLIFLMFLSGFEIDFQSVKSRGKTGTVTPVAYFSLTFLMSLGASFLMAWAGLIANPVLFGLILSTTSVGIVLPTLKEKGTVGSPLGQSLIMSALVADLATMLLLTVYVIHYEKGFSPELFLVFTLFGVFALVYGLGRVFTRVPLIGKVFDEMAHASTQLKVRGALALLLIFVALADSFSVEAILGAFLAGAAVSLFTKEDHGTLGLKLDAIGYGFFVPIFFVVVGAKMNLPALFASYETLLLVPLLLVVAYAVKLVPALLFTRTAGRRDALGAGFLMAARLSLIVAASEVALRIGAIDETVDAAIVLVAIFTSLVSPTVYARLVPKPRVLAGRVFIGGAGRVGRELAMRMLSSNVEVHIVDHKRSQLDKLKASKITKHLGDMKNRSFMDSLAPGPEDVFVAVGGVDNENLAACALARDRGARTIGRDNNPANTVRFREAGIAPIGLKSSIALTIENLILRPDVLHLLADVGIDGPYVFEVRVLDHKAAGTRVSSLAQLGNSLILLVRRGQDLTIPHGATELDYGDHLLVLGTRSEQEQFELKLQGPDGRGKIQQFDSFPETTSTDF